MDQELVTQVREEPDGPEVQLGRQGQALGGVAPAAPLPIGGPGGPREDPVEPEEGRGRKPKMPVR